jgi:protein gp37
VRHTKIEWADYSTNPIKAVHAGGTKPGWFCTKLFAGCANCYSEGINRRFGNGLKYSHSNEPAVEFMLDTKELASIVTGRATPKRDRVFTGPVRVFPCDMIDLFHERIGFDLVDAVWAAMALRPELLFMVLTKRPGRMLEYVNNLTPSFGRAHAAFKATGADMAAASVLEAMRRYRAINAPDADPGSATGPLPNVQLGVSVENQAAADARLGLLLQCPAAARFISYEPALGPMDFTRIRNGSVHGETLAPFNGLQRWTDWKRSTGIDGVIAGGESGTSARPAYPDWFRQVRDQCAAAGVPFFFKAWGEWRSLETGIAAPTHFVCECGHHDLLNDDRQCKHLDGDGCTDATIGICRIGREASGRRLDGRTHDDLPGGR